MRKKTVIIVIALLILIGTGIGIAIGVKHKKEIEERNQKRYAEIKEDIQEDIAGYVRATNVYCNPSTGENNATVIYTDERLINYGGLDKKKLLDVDGESYCKLRVEVRCVAVNEFAWDTYLKCKDYEDEEYSNWEKRYSNKES